MSGNANWTGYTAEERKSCEEMAAWQEAHKLSDARFAGGSGYNETTWGRLRRGIYQGDISGVVATFSRHIVQLRERKLSADKTLRRKFYETDDYLNCKAALKEAQVEAETGGQDKLVCYVAHFGGGKTTLARRLGAEFNGIIIEAMPSWRESYFAACKVIAEGLGIRGNMNSARYAEEQIVSHLKASPQMLIFEEVEYSGSLLLSLWKAILNNTDTVILICFISRFFDEIKRRGGDYADQLLRRANVVKAGLITAGTAEKFLVEHFPEKNKVLKDTATAIAAAANVKGSMHLCYEVARMLAAQCAKHGLQPGDAADAIAAYYQRHVYSDRWEGKYRKAVKA